MSTRNRMRIWAVIAAALIVWYCTAHYGIGG